MSDPREEMVRRMAAQFAADAKAERRAELTDTGIILFVVALFAVLAASAVVALSRGL